MHYEYSKKERLLICIVIGITWIYELPKRIWKFISRAK